MWFRHRASLVTEYDLRSTTSPVSWAKASPASSLPWAKDELRTLSNSTGLLLEKANVIEAVAKTPTKVNTVGPPSPGASTNPRPNSLAR
ncbi:hypothetical protein FRC12_009696 [Ceratobasidium sp. 428]|nr:hypothetical protein FRC12_009696 [Ceratobasidium sp. 428]